MIVFCCDKCKALHLELDIGGLAFNDISHTGDRRKEWKNDNAI